VSYRVVFTPRARAEALEAFRWIAEQSPDSAARWYAGLEKALIKLSQFPGRQPVAEDESERFGITIRQMLYGRRRGIYRILFSTER
jgi:plasmid stabilization system protein ParE